MQWPFAIVDCKICQNIHETNYLKKEQKVEIFQIFLEKI